MQGEGPLEVGEKPRGDNRAKDKPELGQGAEGVGRD